MKKKLLSALIAAAGLGIGASSSAAPVIGLNPSGTGFTAAGCAASFYGCFYSSLWTNITDTGQDVGAFAVGATHTFTTQMAVSSFTNNGTPVSQPFLNTNTFLGFPGYEVTKEIVFNDIITSIVAGGGGTTVTFGNTAQGTSPNLSIYIDTLGDGSQAVRNGPGGVSCYGDGNACAAPDSLVPVLTANVVANASSFTATTPGNGNGSFQITFEITSFNPAYVDVSNLAVNGGTGLPLFSDIITGTLVQCGPGFAGPPGCLGYTPPAATWDGTPLLTDGGVNNAFKVDSSETFGEIPEPGSLALFGIALAGLGALRRRNSSK